MNHQNISPNELCKLDNIALGNTPFGYTLSLINGKYKMIVMYCLYQNKPVVRFNELQRYVGNISVKTLSNTLKELERDELVFRQEYPQIPPKVEYSLTKKGLSMLPIFDIMCQWGSKHQ